MKDQSAGSYLAEGRYGCIFDPALECKPGTKKSINQSKGKNVGKLTSIGEAQHSIEVSLILQTVKNIDKHFILVDSICNPVESEEIHSCNPVKDLKDNEISMLSMPYGGITLDAFGETQKNTLIRNFMPFMQNVLECGVILLLKNLVHFDLHRKNFVVQTLPKLIDFGFIWSPSNLTKENVGNQYRTYNPRLNQESPETTYINGRLPPYSINKDLLIDNIIKQKPIFNTLYQLYGTSIQETKSVFSNFISQSKSISTDNNIEFFKTYWSKFDAWGIGTIITKILYDCMFDPLFVDMIYKPNKKIIDTVVKGLTSADPGIRLDAVEALQIWNPKSQILLDPNVASWIESQSAYRAVSSRAL